LIPAFQILLRIFLKLSRNSKRKYKYALNLNFYHFAMAILLSYLKTGKSSISFAVLSGCSPVIRPAFLFFYARNCRRYNPFLLFIAIRANAINIFILVFMAPMALKIKLVQPASVEEAVSRQSPVGSIGR